MHETRQLSLHPMAIYTFIKAQSGSLGKAVSEAVMNSIDAFATSVDITLTRSGFVIEDDGQGFRDKDEIASWFETLGFPHEEGNHRTFGKFGMGRAQMWAFASTTWQSNQFTMHVDVQKTGLNYELKENPSSAIKGTRITAQFYQPMQLADEQRAIAEISALLKFVPCLVMLNGKAINQDPAKEEWDLDTADAWMRFDTSASLAVYNNGVLVTMFPKYRFGTGGQIVTKPGVTLSLNVARNDILVSECKTWARIAKHIPDDSKKPKAAVRAKLSAVRMGEAGQAIKANPATLRKTLEDSPELITNVLGRAVSLGDMLSMYRWVKPVVFVPKGDTFGKRLLKLKLACVLDRDVLTRFDCANSTEFKELILQSLTSEDLSELSKYEQAYRQSCIEHAQTLTFSDTPQDLFKDLAAGKQVFAHSEGTTEEKATLTAWSHAFTRLHSVLTAEAGLSEGQLKRLAAVRSVRLGDSPVEVYWFDDALRSLVLRKAEAVSALAKGFKATTTYAAEVVKALCFELTETEQEGTELTLAVLTKTNAISTLQLHLLGRYFTECKVRDIPVSTTKLEVFDQLHIELADPGIAEEATPVAPAEEPTPELV